MWKIVKQGGSHGEATYGDVKKYATKEEAQAEAKRWKSSYSKAAQKYYSVKYRVVECGTNNS